MTRARSFACSRALYRGHLERIHRDRISGNQSGYSRMSKLNKLKLHLQRWGWLRTAYLLAMRAAAKFIGLHIFVVRTKSAALDVDVPGELGDLEFRRLDIEELMALVDKAEVELDSDFLQAAHERSDMAFGAFDKSLLTAYTWRSVKTTPCTEGVWVRVERPYAYSYKSFTRPAYRGMHIAPALVLYADKEMLKLGYTDRAAYVEVTNFASLKLGAHMGSHPIGHIGFLNWFGRYFFFRSKRVADIGFEFFKPAGQ